MIPPICSGTVPPVLFEQPSGESSVAVMTTQVGMEYEKQRLWARSEFEPKEARALLLTNGHRFYWNWVVGRRGGRARDA
jgi:hypothetical protein